MWEVTVEPRKDQPMPEENNRIVGSFEAAYAANDVATIDELCAPGPCRTTTRYPTRSHGSGKVGV